MRVHTKMWIQIAGAVVIACLAIAQATGVMRPAFEGPVWLLVLAFASVYMLFEAWRTWRSAADE
jgi:hypothetical protein